MSKDAERGGNEPFGSRNNSLSTENGYPVKRGHSPVTKSGVSSSNLRSAIDITIDFRDVRMWVDIKKKKEVTRKQILSGISGTIRPGQLVAIMGASGSGKSSLLNTLAGRIPRNCSVSGKMLVNGRPVDESFNNVSAYVLQDDILYAQQTVYETLLMAALLRLPKEVSRADKEQVVEDIISQLGLSNCRDTKIGDALTRGVSGGERKRVTIGVELVRNVSAMFLDEPTTGLDSAMSYSLMKSLSALAKETNRVVVCSIHQPRSNIFELFDSILLLSTGKTVYFGDAKQVIPYFSSIGYDCPVGFNYADFILDISVPRFVSGEDQEKSLAQVAKLALEWKTREEDLFAQCDLGGDGGGASDNGRTNADADAGANFKGRGKGATWPVQFVLIFRRSFHEVVRNKFLLAASVMKNIIFALIIGGIFFQLGYDEFEATDRAGVIFFSLTNIGFSELFPVLQSFSTEKAIFLREHQSGFYSTSSYYLAKVASLVPFLPIPIAAYTVILYPMAGLRMNFGNALVLFAIFVLCSASAQSLGIMIGAGAPNMEVAQIIAPMFMIIFMLVSGLFINLENISAAFRWLQWLSFLRFSFAAAMVNEFDGVTFTCDGNELPDGTCRIPDGQAFLEQVTLGNESLQLNFWLLFVFVGVCITLGYLLLLSKVPKLRYLPNGNVSSNSKNDNGASKSKSPNEAPGGAKASSDIELGEEKAEVVVEMDGDRNRASSKSKSEPSASKSKSKLSASKSDSELSESNSKEKVAVAVEGDGDKHHAISKSKSEPRASEVEI